MSEYDDLFIDVAQILLDPVNPRHEPLESQVALIKGMIEVQKDKLVKLGGFRGHDTEFPSPSNQPVRPLSIRTGKFEVSR